MEPLSYPPDLPGEAGDPNGLLASQSELITSADSRILSLHSRLDELEQHLKGFMTEAQPSMNGERYQTDHELAKTLKLSRRTLQEHRLHGILPYYVLGGKILYKESEIEKILQANYNKAFP